MKNQSEQTPLEIQNKVLNDLGLISVFESLLILPYEYMDTSVAVTKLDPNIISDLRLRLFKAQVLEIVKKDKDGNLVNHNHPINLQVKVEFDCGRKLSLFVNGKTEIMKWITIKVGYRVQFSGCIVYKDPYLNIQRLNLESKPYKVKAVPIYLGIPGKLSGADIEKCIKSVIPLTKNTHLNNLITKDSIFVKESLAKVGFQSVAHFIYELHHPINFAKASRNLEIAKRICIRQIQNDGRVIVNPKPNPLLQIDSALIHRASQQPEKISNGQREALNLIRKQINRQHCSRILLNGDVGSGKTLVFLLIASAIADSGLVSCILVPNEIVAKQIYAQCLKRFPDLRSGLVTSVEKNYKDCQIIIGTQALLFVNDLPELGLVVIDEQHKFSNDQRKKLVSSNTHVIEATATPIPRSLALALFCDWVEVQIKGMPVNKSIKSSILKSNIHEERKEVVFNINKALELNKKVIFLYASVGKHDSSCIKAAARLQQHYPGRIAMVHGKMKPEEKNREMEAFRQGERPILIASTAIEVGVDVPDVAILVINQADRFGVSQLHQIRGRLVRNGGEGQFFMMVDKEPSKKTLQRLTIVKDNTDGFQLAEKDMDLRGFGELINDSKSQSGNQQVTFFKLPRLTTADFYN